MDALRSSYGRHAGFALAVPAAQPLSRCPRFCSAGDGHLRTVSPTTRASWGHNPGRSLGALGCRRMQGGWSRVGCRAFDDTSLRPEHVTNHYGGEQEPESQPVWMWALKFVYRSCKELIQFLWEQPGQLKYIEFTPFDSMVKMAFLTLGVVILLIIFLATVDSAFSYILAAILRKVP